MTVWDKLLVIWLIHSMVDGTIDLVDKVISRSKGKIPLTVFLMVVKILAYMVILVS